MAEQERGTRLQLDTHTRVRLHVEAAARGLTVKELVDLAVGSLPPVALGAKQRA
jgi:hypothetical protein